MIRTRPRSGMPVGVVSDARQRCGRAGMLTIDNASYEAPGIGIAADTIHEPMPVGTVPDAPADPTDEPAMGPTDPAPPTLDDHPR